MKLHILYAGSATRFVAYDIHSFADIAYFFNVMCSLMCYFYNSGNLESLPTQCAAFKRTTKVPYECYSIGILKIG